MRLNSKGQVTIPAALRQKYGFREGDEVDVIEEGSTLKIVHRDGEMSAAERHIRRMRGSAGPGMTTDELMELLRGD
ncbi:AbrB/MazE/SpoVT family DNA-binding domain-containing protein [Gryllotalpicola koreensis]|uniref:SpoVT-AbrB domain-containing protein n=1 Tax=Gryllotalpicola koreensis TaxID=993086 RepID=A0ABP7ZPS6_9MICO